MNAFIFSLLVLAASILPSAAVHSPVPQSPGVETLRRVKIYHTWATNRFTRQSLCVYRGPSRDLARRHQELWNRRPGWNAAIRTEKY